MKLPQLFMISNACLLLQLHPTDSFLMSVKHCDGEYIFSIFIPEHFILSAY